MRFCHIQVIQTNSDSLFSPQTAYTCSFRVRKMMEPSMEEHHHSHYVRHVFHLSYQHVEHYGCLPPAGPQSGFYMVRGKTFHSQLLIPNSSLKRVSYHWFLLNSIRTVVWSKTPKNHFEHSLLILYCV